MWFSTKVGVVASIYAYQLCRRVGCRIRPVVSVEVVEVLDKRVGADAYCGFAVMCSLGGWGYCWHSYKVLGCSYFARWNSAEFEVTQLD